MPDISSIGHGSLEPLSRPASASTPVHRNGTASSDAPGRLESDRVELSDHARFLDKMRKLPSGRLELVQQVKQSIAQGTYETDDKFNQAISRLIDDLDP